MKEDLYMSTHSLYVLNSKFFITFSVSVVDNTFLLPVESCNMHNDISISL